MGGFQISKIPSYWSFIRLAPSLSCRLPGPPPTSEDDLTLRRLLYSQRQAGQPISAQYLPLGARTERLAARADRAARADLPQLTRQQ